MYPECARSATSSNNPSPSHKRPRAPQDFYERERRARNRHLRRLAADLPFAIHDAKHGWGVILKPEKRRGRWWSEPHWYLVNYATGVECRLHKGEGGGDQFFTWEKIIKDFASREKERAELPAGYVTPRTLWWHIFKMWD